MSGSTQHAPTSNLFLPAALLWALALMILAAPSDRPEPPSLPPAETVVVEPVGNKMEYATKTIEAKSGTQLTIVMNNTATNAAMHHNVAVLDLAVSDGDAINAVGAAAMKVGEAGGYIPEHDALLAATPMAAPGERTEITFTVPPPGKYPYVCLYPGHYVVMRGVLVSTP